MCTSSDQQLTWAGDTHQCGTQQGGREGAQGIDDGVLTCFATKQYCVPGLAAQARHQRDRPKRMWPGVAPGITGAGLSSTKHVSSW